MEITKIDQSNIRSIADFIKQKKDSCIDLAANFNAEPIRQAVNRNWTKLIIKTDTHINTIVIDCNETVVDSVTFYGLIDLTFSDLDSLFGKSVEHFERYDDTYEFIFNENFDFLHYGLKCFYLKKDRKLPNWQDLKLDNLSIRFNKV